MLPVDEVELYKYSSMEDVVKGVTKAQIQVITNDLTPMIMHFMQTHPPGTVNEQIHRAKGALEDGLSHYKGHDQKTRYYHALQIVGQWCGWKILDLMIAQGITRKMTSNDSEAKQLFFGLLGQALLDTDSETKIIIQ